ncbi:hypothetical protein [uncultured Hyphomicrobium sp.]|uniref:hypothetical protein n=1 Tax=uncultured Hyphomicrobium sp. TaxID=194373 RepID=UPI0025F20EA2|nr:hypothetical protein [uncultured Hyphomicrobium sp.]
MDDSSQLRRVADLLEADPNLKPTTAIKAIGVSDPSTIRRLREKLKVEPLRSTGGGAGVAEFPAALGAAPQVSDRAPAPAGTGFASAGSSAGLAEASVSALSESETALFAKWCALGLSAVSSTLEAHVALMTDLLRTPQVACALRQQILFNEVAKALCPKRSDIRTFH